MLLKKTAGPKRAKKAPRPKRERKPRAPRIIEAWITDGSIPLWGPQSARKEKCDCGGEDYESRKGPEGEHRCKYYCFFECQADDDAAEKWTQINDESDKEKIKEIKDKMDCANGWSSRHTWWGSYQACKKCKHKNYPVKIKLLGTGDQRVDEAGLGKEEEGDKTNPKSHQYDLCGMCQTLGHNCWWTKKKAALEEKKARDKSDLERLAKMTLEDAIHECEKYTNGDEACATLLKSMTEQGNLEETYDQDGADGVIKKMQGAFNTVLTKAQAIQVTDEGIEVH